MQNNCMKAESYQKLIRRDERIRKTVGITRFFEFFELFPLAPENCDLNNFVWVFLLTLSRVFRLSIKYGLSGFLLSVCCHADRNSIANFKEKFNSFEEISFYYYQHNRKQASKHTLCCFVILIYFTPQQI